MVKQKHSSKQSPGGLVNRRARFDYELSDELVAGLELTGPEVRAARDGHVQLRGAFVSIKDNQLWLNNASFSLKLNQRGASDRSIDTTPRRLLLSRRQIDELISKRKDGLSIIPTKLLTNGRFIKVVIALGRGKKKYDKRETIKRRDINREHSRQIRSNV